MEASNSEFTKSTTRPCVQLTSERKGDRKLRTYKMERNVSITMSFKYMGSITLPTWTFIGHSYHKYRLIENYDWRRQVYARLGREARRPSGYHAQCHMMGKRNWVGGAYLNILEDRRRRQPQAREVGLDAASRLQVASGRKDKQSYRGKIRKLDSVGFEWETSSAAIWNERFQQLSLATGFVINLLDIDCIEKRSQLL